MTSEAQTDGTRELGPFQRSALGAGTRLLEAAVEVPGVAPAELGRAVAESLSAAPVLTARTVHVPGLLVPRQEARHVRTTETSGHVSLTAGSLRAAITATPGGSHLAVTCDVMFADTASIGLLFTAVADRLAGRARSGNGPGFFDVAAGHSAMARTGELAEETAFWADSRLRVPDGALSLADAIPAPGEVPGVGEVELDGTGAGAVAAEARSSVEDIAHLALAVVVQRIGMPHQAVGITADARGLMGLPEVIGPLTQVVPAPWRLDLAQDAVTALRAAAEDRTRRESMVGGPALAQIGERPSIVFDGAGRPALPPGWVVTRWSYPVDGVATLGLRRNGDRLVLDAVSAGGDTARAAALLSMWGAVLGGLLRSPGTPLADLPLVPPEPAAELAARLVPPASPAPRLIDRFREHVAATPDASAVRHGDVTWDYARLAARVGDIAAAVGEMPVGTVVGVLGEHEPDVLAATLAMLWKGCAFLPLSPSEPSGRIHDALSRSGAGAVLLGRGAEVSAPPGCRAVVLSEVPESGTPLPDAVPAGPESLAYVLRTSGSTGVPKLVGIRRSSLDNYLSWTAEDLLGDGAEMPVLSSTIFDASFKQTLGVLHAGRCVWIPRADRLDTAAIHAELSAAGVPLVLNCVPSYLSVLIAEQEARGAGMSVRRFLCGGEPLKPALVSRLREGWPEAEVWNLYGPTEATATATAGRVVDGEPVTVGVPVAGAGVVAVDAGGQVLPHGVRGELAITGPGLATGYLSGHEGRSPFIRLRLGDHEIAAYRTGDLGVVSGSGAVVVLGRIDDQVKINGWRIEPAEVEAVAQGVSGVKDAVVVLDDRADERRLRLFVTGAAEVPAVAEALAALLPAPMVPASITVVDRFDTGVTGKVDRRALLRRVDQSDHPAPSDYDPVELEVATVWRDVVRQGWPRPDDDFFGAGGHSLHLARLVNVLRANGHEQLSLRKVVRRPTVSSIASAIRGEGSGQDGSAEFRSDREE
ncbi:AMP-binding protein [Lentzea sp. NPDC004789]